MREKGLPNNVFVPRKGNTQYNYTAVEARELMFRHRHKMRKTGNTIKQYQVTNEPFVPIVDILTDGLRYWKWIVLFFLICMGAAYAIIITTQRQYRTSLSVLLNEGQGSGASSVLSLNELGILSTVNNLENEITILLSPNLMAEVVDSLPCLRTIYSISNGFRKDELFMQTPYFATYDDRKNLFPRGIELSLTKSENSYQLEGHYLEHERKTLISQKIETFPAHVVLGDSIGIITLELTGKQMQKNKKYFATLVSPQTAAAMLCGGLSVSQSSEQSSVLNISLRVNNIEKGRMVLKELVRQYNLLHVRVNNQLAINTAEFINDRLKHVAIELSEAEREVVDYKQEHRIADLGEEAHQSISQSGQNRQKLMDVETQLNVLSLVNQFVNDPANELKAIPNLGINDPDLSRIISEYNQTIITSDALLKSTGDENPTRIRISEDIDNLRNSIANSLRNVEQAYTISKRDLQHLSGMTQSHIRAIPQQEKGLIEKVRQQQIKESLFLFLMQKREEVNLSMATYADKARVIVSPQWSGGLVAPHSKNILIVGLIISCFVPFVIIFYRNAYNRNIRNRNELEKLSTVTIAGEIGKKEGKETGMVLTEEQQATAIAETFRSLRNNLSFILKPDNHKCMLVTSTVAGEGKTFISINLALSFALTGKKVLLIDGDIRSPKIAKSMGFEKQKGLVDYLVNDDAGMWEKYVHESKHNPNLHLLFAGTIPPNPNELLLSNKLVTFFSEVKESFDMIIVDSAPVGLVSDAYLLSSYMDVVLYVVREGKTSKEAVYFMNSQKWEGKLNNMYLVYNDATLAKNYKYGYGYDKKLISE